MKKTLLVAAVATAMSGAASAADMYGNIRLGLQNTDELDVVSGKLVLGSVGSEDLGNGMELSYGVEFEHDGADAEQPGSLGSATLSNDKSWVGLGGGFGKVVIGEHSDMAGWACGGTDILTYGTDEACSLGHNTSPANAIQYRGGADNINFGVAMTQDGTGESNTLVGFQFSGDGFAVGAQLVTAGPDASFGGVPADESGSVIGGWYMLGDITLGLALGDNGVDDGAATSIGVQLPLGAGNLAFLLTDGDVDATTSTDLMYTQGLGENGYWGVEFNSNDAIDDDRTVGFLGTTF